LLAVAVEQDTVTLVQVLAVLAVLELHLALQ
jgi:hypothetical protein